MPTTYPLDLTGASPTNLITNEVHTFATANDRIFPLAAGPFFTIGLKLYHGTTNELLAPVTQYKALQLHRAGSLVSGKEVCAIVIVEDTTITSVRVEYQCIGGIYSSEATLLHDLIANNPLPDVSVIWGQIFGTPVQFPPVEHLHHIDNIYGAEEIVAVLERLRIAIAAGDSPSIAAVYQHIHTLLANSNYVTEQQVIDLLSNTAVPWQLKADLHGSATEVFNLKSDPIVGVAPTEGINAAYLAVQFAALWQRLTVNGIDADLAVTNNASGLNLNDLQFRVPGEWYFTHAINAVKLNTPGILIVRKAGNKVYQHIILETGQEGNRHFNGIAWVPWSVQSGTGVTSIPISSSGDDLNDYTAEGFFNFKTSDNLLNAPPTQGIESDFTLQVITVSGDVIQIAKNITTQTDFVRVKNGINWQFNWQSTAPIQNIVSGINLDAVRSENVYLCINPVINLPQYYGTITPGTSLTVCILQVKSSDTVQSVVQILQLVNGEFSDDNWGPAGTILFRSALDGSANFHEFVLWRQVNKVPVGPYKHVGSHGGSEYVIYYQGLDTRLTYHNDLNRLLRQGFYVFSLTDDISNIPAQFTDSDFFLFLLVEVLEDENNGDWTVIQQIYQYIYIDNYEHRLIRQQTFSQQGQQGQPITASWTTYPY